MKPPPGTGAGGDALYDLVADDERGAAQVEHAAIGCGRAELDFVVPCLFAGARIERDDAEIGHRGEDVAVAKAEAHLHGGADGWRMDVPPHLLTTGGVDRDDGVGRGVEEHDAVVDQRGRHGEAGRQLECPGGREAGNVVAVDDFERAEILAVIGAAPMQPVAGRGVFAHRLRDGRKGGHAFFGRCRRRRRFCDRRGGSCGRHRAGGGGAGGERQQGGCSDSAVRETVGNLHDRPPSAHAPSKDAVRPDGSVINQA